MPAIPTTSKGKPAEATILDGLNLVFSTTHLLGKEQANAYYHDTGVRV